MGPRGLFLTETKQTTHRDPATGEIVTRDVPIVLKLSNSPRDASVIAVPPFTLDDVNAAKGEVGMNKSNGNISPEKATVMKRVLDQIATTVTTIGATSISEQFTVINAILYPKMFHESVRGELPRLAVLDCERIMSTALAQLLEQGDPLLESIMFDPKVRSEFVQLTRNTSVVQSTDLLFTTDYSGGFVPLRLSEDDNALEGVKKTRKKGPKEHFKIPLDKESVIQGIREGRFIAGSGLTFAMLALAGIDALGGSDQAFGYLPEFQRGFATKLEEWGKSVAAETVRQLDAHRISDSLPSVLVQRDILSPAGMFDMISMRGVDRQYGLTEEDLAKLNNLTMHELVSLAVPTIYRRSVPPIEQKQGLLDISLQEVVNDIGVDRLIVIPQ
jgi:hypothetical protein